MKVAVFSGILRLRGIAIGYELFSIGWPLISMRMLSGFVLKWSNFSFLTLCSERICPLRLAPFLMSSPPFAKSRSP